MTVNTANFLDLHSAEVVLVSYAHRAQYSMVVDSNKLQY
jgi:hypothetical protein